MTDPKENLLPCPFCRSKAGIQQDITGKERYHVVCNSLKCKCPMISGMPWRNTPEEAADDWNRRFNGWVSVKKSLPAVGEYGDVDVLIHMEDGFIATATYDENDGWELWADADKVTHWMPLPQAPEGSGE